MDSVNKTLYIPLYGKAYVSRLGIILRDKKAEAIWEAAGFPLKGKSASKWLAYYMGMRSAVFDRWVKEQLEAGPDAVVLHIGCGLDSRAERIGIPGQLWYDIDFPDVIQERKRHYRETEHYHMLPADVREEGWLEQIPSGHAIVVMEGVSMYIQPEACKQLLRRLGEHFAKVSVLMDCYTEVAAKASRFSNPINDVGVTKVYGLDDPKLLEDGTGPAFAKRHDMTPEDLINQLSGLERFVFRKVYAGTIAEKMYRLYEYEG